MYVLTVVLPESEVTSCLLVFSIPPPPAGATNNSGARHPREPHAPRRRSPEVFHAVAKDSQPIPLGRQFFQSRPMRVLRGIEVPFRVWH